jgi:hypothetical protein
MAFADLAKGLKLPEGASDRYRILEALGRMLAGGLYDDLKYKWEDEKANSFHIPTRERRPSLQFGLPWEITQDTLTELFGDEQFPTVRVVGDNTDDQTKELANLIEAVDLPSTMVEAYEEGVVGAVGVVIHETSDGMPYYEVLPAKWCEPQYKQYSNVLQALTITYPISDDEAEKRFPGITKKDENKSVTTYWYRYIVGPMQFVDYYPLADDKYARLGEKNEDTGEVIEFIEYERKNHRFTGRVPAVYVKNLGGKQRNIDGPALWWPIRDICIVIDYTLSQADRGLRYAADPMLFLRVGGEGAIDAPGGYAPPGGGMATETGEGGSMVRGVTQTFIGVGKNADAKLLEIGAAGIKEEREFVRDCREYALEVIGGMKARAEHTSGQVSGRAIDKNMKPLRRLIRRQRRPYGRNLLLELVVLTIFGLTTGALSVDGIDVDKLPTSGTLLPEWPSDDVLQGNDLYYHIEGLQLAAGGSAVAPLQIMSPDAIGRKMAADLGYHEPYESLKGNQDPPEEPEPATPGA